MMRFPKRKNPRQESEDDIQAMAERLLDALGYQYVHIPNSMWRVIATQAPPQVAREASRYLKGLPDLVVLRKAGEYNNCLLLEIKRDGGRVRDSQRAWAKGLSVVYAHGWAEAETAIMEWHKKGERHESENNPRTPADGKAPERTHRARQARPQGGS